MEIKFECESLLIFKRRVRGEADGFLALVYEYSRLFHTFLAASLANGGGYGEHISCFPD